MIAAAALEAIRTRGGVEQAPGIAVAVLRSSRLADMAAVGALQPWTKVRAASLSKLPVGMLALMLAEGGGLALDAPVDVGFPLRHPAYPNTPITLRQLLSHTASLADGEVYWGTLGETLADFFTPTGAHWENGGHFLTDKPPGAWFSYCNLASGVVASLLERASGRRFDQLAHERLFGPLGLTCGYNWSEVPADEIAGGSAVYRFEDGAWRASVDAPGARRVGPVFAKEGAALSAYRLGDNGLLFSPQGGLRASVLDFARLGAVILGGGAVDGVRLMRPETVRLLTTPAWTFDPARPNGDPYGGLMLAQGLGAMALTPEASPIPGQPRTLWGHAAEAYGLLGGLWLDPATGAGFAYLVNGERAPRAKGVRSAAYAIEEELMTLLAEAAFG